MEEISIISHDDVIKIGKDFGKDEVDYFMEFGDCICETLNTGEIIRYTGIVYELCTDETVSYYRTMVDGLNTGEYVRFFYDGSLKDFSQMFSGTIHGNSYSWHENGKLSLFSNRKYGRIIFLKEWDENGILVKEITAPSESDINEIKKYDQFFKELKEKQDEIQQKTGKEKKSTEYDRTVAIKFNLP